GDKRSEYFWSERFSTEVDHIGNRKVSGADPAVFKAGRAVRVLQSLLCRPAVIWSLPWSEPVTLREGCPLTTPRRRTRRSPQAVCFCQCRTGRTGGGRAATFRRHEWCGLSTRSRLRPRIA